MKYIKVSNIGFIADPQNWEELKWTLHNEDGMLLYDPNVEKFGLGKALLARFG